MTTLRRGSEKRAILLAPLILTGCTTVNSLYADAQIACEANGWDSQQCAYAMRRANLAEMAPQDASASMIHSGVQMATQPPRRY